MSSIHIITASAGTGKTTRLAQEIERAVASGEARPEAIVAVTFTKKAAAELAERSRSTLSSGGRVQEADRMLAARIGTVHAVCGRLVAEHALRLGLSPYLDILDEQSEIHAFAEAMTGVLTEAECAALDELSSRMPRFEWRTAVRRLVAAARTNRTAANELEGAAARSVSSILELFGEPVADCDERLLDALRNFVGHPDIVSDTVKKTKEALVRARRVLGELERGEAPAWPDWVFLSQLDISKKLDAVGEDVREAALLHDRHPRLRDDLERAIVMVYSLAARTMGAFERWKSTRGVLDFVDQEVYALALLELPDVAAELRAQIDLVVVDEFQDTSPIQLEIFLRLAHLAKRCVWVGDPKQAIFGFRGTDPSLMTATVDGLVECSDPELVARALDALPASKETLDVSYRSRPSLVALTSSLFTPVFAAQSIPEDEIQLTAAAQEDPEALGAPLEYWPLAARQDADALPALARTVDELLDDGTAFVRDRDRGAVRRARLGDVAVLCATNKQCATLAAALEKRGRRASVASTNLLDTLEARLVIAVLRIWLNPGDRHAAASIRRIVEVDDTLWLEQTLQRDIEPHPLIARSSARSAAARRFGTMDAFDAAMSEADALLQVARFADGSRRCANLDALRAIAVSYVDGGSAFGRVPTLSGLLAQLERLRRPPPGQPRTDQCASGEQEDAIAVLTWHAAKGLEWPIVVLYGLDRQHDPDPFGVEVVDTRSSIDLAAPLAGRWVRYWPLPYHGVQKGTPLRERLAARPSDRARSLQEDLRLLYVGWTRARDRLVLAAAGGRLFEGVLGAARALHDDVLETPTSGAQWFGCPVHIRIAEGAAPNDAARTPPAQSFIERPPPRAHPPAFVAPSTLEESGDCGEIEVIGGRTSLNAAPDLELVGQAVHTFIAADDLDFAQRDRMISATRALAAWGVEEVFGAAQLVAMSSALLRWISDRWPDAPRRCEVPVLQRRKDGSVVRGFVDLLIDTPEGWVIVDHKCFPGGRTAALERAGRFGGQLAAYAGAVHAATKRPVAEMFVHLPISGMVIPVRSPTGGRR